MQGSRRTKNSSPLVSDELNSKTEGLDKCFTVFFWMYRGGFRLVGEKANGGGFLHSRWLSGHSVPEGMGDGRIEPRRG